MQKNYNVTGEQRKQMVQVISREVGMEPVYMRMPTCAYAISNITVSKTGEMIWDERTDGKVITRVMEALAAAGFTAADAEPETEEEPDAEPEALVIEMPRDGFTEEALHNLQKLVDSKASLLKKSIGTDDLAIEVTDEKIRFPWFSAEDTENAGTYMKLISAVCKAAKEAKRVTASDRAVDSEKYAFRTWLLRLGFIGAEYKADRKILMRNLSGTAAFKNAEDARAFAEKQKAKKAAQKAASEDEAQA